MSRSTSFLLALTALCLCAALVPSRSSAQLLVISLPSGGTAMAGQITGNQWLAFRPAGGGPCAYWQLGGVEVAQDFRIVGSGQSDAISVVTSTTTFCGFTMEPLVQGARWMVVFAQGGNDLVVGGYGPSQIMGGADNDVMIAGAHGTTAWAVGDGGLDSLFALQYSARLLGGSGNDRLCVWANPAIVQQLNGGSGIDCARGTSWPNPPVDIDQPCSDYQCQLF